MNFATRRNMVKHLYPNTLTGVYYNSYMRMLDREKLIDTLNDWCKLGTEYPITEEEKVKMGFVTVEEIAETFGVKVHEDHLYKTNLWAYAVFCAIRYIAEKMNVNLPLARFIEYRRSVLTMCLLNQGLLPFGWEAYDTCDAFPVARTKMFTTNLIPRPIDKTAARVTGL